MNEIVLFSKKPEPISRKEVFRYAKILKPQADMEQLLDECIAISQNALNYKACYCIYNVEKENGHIDLGFKKFYSNDLYANLKNANEVVLFCATLGTEFDRLILRYAKTSPSKAVMLQAIGAERIEAFCDKIESSLKETLGCGLRPRFSPGYGDLSIELQRDIFTVLNPQKNIGVFLNDSLLMSPSKSVTAIIGVER